MVVYSRTRTNKMFPIRVLPLLSLLSLAAFAQLPEGPGKAETLKLCSGCHGIEASYGIRLDRNGWQSEVAKMVEVGMVASDEEIARTLDYLAKNFADAPPPRLNVNKASAAELEAGLALSRSVAAAVVAYRAKNGAFQSPGDLKKVPGIDGAKIDASKDQLAF